MFDTVMSLQANVANQWHGFLRPVYRSAMWFNLNAFTQYLVRPGLVPDRPELQVPELISR